MSSRSIAHLGIGLLAVSMATAPLSAQVTEGVTVEGITQYTLDNGLEVLLFPDQSKQTTTVNITYYVGSRHEAYGETGMAHLLEHLVFKGTPNHPDIPQELTEHGSRPNGTTWFDRTNYFETFPASAQNLAWAIDLEADRMVNSFISAEDLESEMTVVRNEFELGENDPFGVTMERTLSTAFLWHNYGKSTIGARADLEHVPIERLQAFYRRYYQPDNAVLVVAGKFDPEQALELVVEDFGVIPRPDRSGEMKLWDTYTLDPTQDGERSVTVRRAGDTQLSMVAYKVPAGSDPSFAAVDVLAQVYSTRPSGRLYQALVKPGLAANVGAFAFQLREPGVLLAFAEVRMDGNLDSASNTMIETFESGSAHPITEEEVERAKTNLLKNIELGFNASDQIGMQLSEWASMGDWRLIFLHRDRIRDVTVAGVEAVAQAYLKPANRTVGRFIPSQKPDRAEIPPPSDVAVMVAGYEGSAEVAQGEAFDPSVANVESRTTRMEFDNGFQVALLPKKTRGNEVVVNGSLHFGSEAALMGRRTAAGLAGSMLLRGTATKSRQEIKDEFDRLKAQVQVGGSATSANFSVVTTREYLADVLQLLGEVLREPAFDEPEFLELKQERLAGLERQKSEPTQLGIRTFQRHLSPRPEGHPAYIPTFEEAVADLTNSTVEQAQSFYADFYGVGVGEVAVVGDFDPDEIVPVLEGVFAAWNSPREYQRIPSPYQAVEPVNLSIETPDKANAIFLVGKGMPLSDEDEEYPALVLANYMLGGGFLNSRLATRIRQEEGLSYAVGSQFFAAAQDENGMFLGYAIYAPENLAALEASFISEIEKALAEGFSVEEIAAAKAGFLESRSVSRAQDPELAGRLSSAMYDRRTLEYDAGVEAAISALTNEAIVAAMRRQLDPSAMTIIKAGDFAKQREEEAPTP